ncbi:hypothetical protein, partial [Escherichia coli]|uniref:hypothetical protein n=1 Tax=Escherichia coli TaxID=562 RepID=UPI0013D1838B
DLNFAVFKALSEEGLIPAMGTPSSIVPVQGLEGVQGALGAIAGGLGKSGDATSAEPSALAEPDADVRSGTSRAPSRRKLERS